MYTKNSVLRFSIIISLTTVVAAILWYTPLPGQEFVSCERPCHELEMPMICRIKLVIESYQTLSRSCSNCPDNSSECYKKYKHCISGDGVKRSLLTANRRLPGPNIQVCENDILVVDVINRVPGHEVTIHWRGQPLSETPFMDGVPLLTQCPVSSSTTFQYKFRATRPGTHVWHAQSDEYSDGVVGGFIVRQTESRILERDLYDVDSTSHVVVVNAWRDSSTIQDSLLINGRSQSKNANGEFPATVFTVASGKRHRFRLVHAGGRGNHCPITVSVDQHTLNVIALDGYLIAPRLAHSISLAAGERADFILHADQSNSSYFMKASTSEDCVSPAIHGLAILRYDASDANITDSDVTDADDAAMQPSIDADDADDGLFNEIESRELLTTHRMCEKEKGDMCLTEMEARQKLPDALKAATTDVQIFLSFGYRAMAADDNDLSVLLWSNEEKIPHINNLTFIYPSSPLLTQPDNVNSDLICNEDKIPASCDSGGVCQCVHVVDIPLGSSVELVLLDEGGSDLDHVFHLHGYNFHVVALKHLSRHVTSLEAKKLDQVGKLVSRNLDSPVVKDTIAVPHKSVAVLRLVADNPGYWLLDNDRSRGLNVVLRVGGSADTPITPEDFPKCGSWIGPEFFFI